MPNNHHITALEELRDWLRELRVEISEMNDGIEEYNEGCPAQLRAIAKRDKIKSRADAIDTTLSLLAERENLVAIPEGWNLVPVEPTDEMLDAGQHTNSEWLNDDAPLGERMYRDPAKAVYACMLAAAPQPPKGDGDENSR